MNQEPRLENPYDQMSDEELSYRLWELQMAQDELNQEFNRVQRAIVNKHIERFER